MKHIAIFLVISIHAIVEGKKDSSSSHNDILKDDYGILKSCDSSLSQFEVKWTPKELKFEQQVSISGYIIPNMDAAEVRGCLNVTVDGIEGPIISECARGGCHKLKKFFPQFAKFCPLQKGKKVEVKSYDTVFKPPVQLTPGTYHIKALINHFTTHAPVACIAGDVTIAEDYDYDNYDDYNY